MMTASRLRRPGCGLYALSPHGRLGRRPASFSRMRTMQIKARFVPDLGLAAQVDLAAPRALQGERTERARRRLRLINVPRADGLVHASVSEEARLRLRRAGSTRSQRPMQWPAAGVGEDHASGGCVPDRGRRGPRGP